MKDDARILATFLTLVVIVLGAAAALGLAFRIFVLTAGLGGA